ncbi:PspA/IM30 family protein [Roseateles oligotrophus]|uniref:PspA/IM30 family protein n=1 Tax=Roseateles oligotrophus TaxID=1769250 RepID=A0ABT2YEZ0_9BURK|nr:PspA/IM30 family protein [Roseateles oligotrophus]MCV2368618.1 PspA/IM30 family protein [Roseateles oligotrophus]
MAESLKMRVARVMAGGVHALLDRIEDRAPDALMEQGLRELDGVVNDVRLELGLVSANRHLAQQRHAELNRQHLTLHEQLALAMTQQRDDLARAAVGRQMDIELQLPLLESSLAELAQQEAQHRGVVDALLAKRREMEATLSQFRQSRAAAGLAAGKSGSAASLGGLANVEARVADVTGAFDRVYERHTGLGRASGVASSADLTQATQLQSLEDLLRQTQIDARLAQLKQAVSGTGGA